MQISSYTIGIRFDIGQREWRKLDQQLKTLEKRLTAFSQRMNQRINLNISSFNIDQRALNFALGTALDRASRISAFQVSRFVVDQQALNRTIASAVNRATATAHINLSSRGGHGVQEGGRGISGRHLAGAGGIGGLAARAWTPALAVAGGGYGLAATNRRNQEVVSAQLQTQSTVMQAGGTQPQGVQVFDWLRSEGNRVGFNYLDSSSDFNTLLSGLTGAGMSIGQGQDVFRGFSELSRVNKLDRTRQSRVFRALSQIAGKDKLQAEELTGQLAESLPGATAIFAQAYQRQQGGNLTGSAATSALMEAMKKGQVRGNILPLAAQIASERAQPGLAAARTASQAEQSRFQNSYNDLAILASNSGIEEGFARIFRTLSSGAESSTGGVQALARAFNETTKFADDLLLFPAEFAATLNGKNGLIAEWLGADKTDQLRKDWQEVKNLVQDIIGFETPQWLPTLESTTREIAGLLRQIASFQQWMNNLKNSPDAAGNASFATQPITASYQFGSRLFSDIGDRVDRAKERQQAIYGDPNSIYYQDPAGYDAEQRDRAMAAAIDQSAGLSTKNSTFNFDSINISVPYDPAISTPEDQGNMLADWFTARVQDTLTQYTEK